MHKTVEGLEWSGLIFYDVEGDISDPANMKLKVVDFVLLDIGTAGYTEFKLGVNLFDVFDEKPHLMGKQYGLMHSHHKMKAFFSGTDSENLHESAAMFNFYLSLIVNIEGDFVAKVSVQGRRESHGINYTKNNKGQMTKVEFSTSCDCVFVYDCDIKWESSQIHKVDTLKKAKAMSRKDSSTFAWDLEGKSKSKQLPIFDGSIAEEAEVEAEDDLGIDLKTANFEERCICYVEKLTFLDIEDPTMQEELERMSGLNGELWDEVEEDSEVLLHVLFESYLGLDTKTLKIQRGKVIKEIKDVLSAHNCNKDVFLMFELLFNSAFEIYE